jgi:hypothetical protein
MIWKVDISTMLEEAAQYVKFLQLQIKVGYQHLHARRLNIWKEKCVILYLKLWHNTNFVSNNYVQLLSSDDTWMYAPIAYNGINISNVDLNIPSLQK